MSQKTEYAKMFATFPLALRRFLRERLTLEDARRIVRERLARREVNFLQMLERNVFNFPSSPYLKLLKHAGCELEDVRTILKEKGLDSTLKTLREAGVYITFEEFKGREPIKRNGLTLPVRASDFDNPFAKNHMWKQTSGSTGAAVQVAIDLNHIAARASNRMIALDAHGLLGAPFALYRGIMPDRTMGQLLFGALTGNLPQRWFSPIGLRDSNQWVKYGLGTYYLIACMRLAGVPIPLPEYVKPDRGIIVARWAAAAAGRHGRCMVRAGTSRAVGICHDAEQAGVDLTGVTFVGAGEPATVGKMEHIRRAGARFISNYGMSESGQPAAGCANPVTVSDYHLFQDTFALFSYPYHVKTFDVTVPAFNLTTLLPNSPKVMFNVQIDDYGIVEERRCGCPLEAYGFTTHLREIRSYSKLTGEGVTLIGNEIVHILEQVLPARFGGSPLDYQLMEQEDAQGLTRLYLVISPRIEIANESAAVDCLLEALRTCSPAADVARLVWHNAHSLQVKRIEPVWGKGGKFLPLHVPHRHP